MSLNTATAAIAELEQLRSERRLRALTPDEEGTDIYRLPDGVFGYTYAPGLREVPIFSKRHYGGFEVHREAGGKIHLVGFVTADEKAAISSSKQAVQVVIFPASWEQSTELVSVVDARLQPAKKAVARVDGNPFKTLVFPA